MLKQSKFYIWLFRCQDGSYIYGQAPNIPIIVAGVTFVLAIIIPDPSIKSTLNLIFRLSVIIWAILELCWGVNNFRRILGLIVLLAVCAGVLMR